MASWFRAAEELFEVVDRRAKRVTDDLLVGGQNSAADLGVFGRVLVTSPLTKVQSGSGKVLADASLQANDSSTSFDFSNTTYTAGLAKDGMQEKRVLQSADGKALDYSEVSEIKPENGAPSITSLNTVLVHGHDEVDTDRVVSKQISEDDGTKLSEEGSTTNNELVQCKLVAENGEISLELIAKPSTLLECSSGKDVDASVVEKVQILEKAENGTSANFVLHSLHEDQKPKEVPKLEEQLDEAQKLLKGAPFSGQSKEARLARVCAGLSSRLQEYKSENGQLERLLQNEREENSTLRNKIKDVQLELTSARTAVNLAEAEMSSAFASKNAEIEALLNSLESFKKQAAHSEGKLAALQADMEVMARRRDMTENGMIQTLKEALDAAENRAEEEHLSHMATRKAAAQREAELEQCVADVTASLTRMQRTVDERTQKAAELEQKLLSLEIDYASLTQELQEAEAKLRKEQKKMSEEATQTSQIQAWREDADRARQAQRETEGRNLALEAENQKLRVELAASKRDADHFSSQAQVELEKRFRELTEVLYSKQTQLEAMASEKAAAIFQLEELSRAKEALADAERSKRMQQSIAIWDDESEMKPLETLALQQRRLVGSSIQVKLQKAAKFLDTGAVTAGRFLWRRPLARLGVLLYLVFVHVFLLYLLHRLQEQVLASISSKEELMTLGMHH